MSSLTRQPPRQTTPAAPAQAPAPAAPVATSNQQQANALAENAALVEAEINSGGILSSHPDQTEAIEHELLNRLPQLSDTEVLRLHRQYIDRPPRLNALLQGVQARAQQVQRAQFEDNLQIRAEAERRAREETSLRPLGGGVDESADEREQRIQRQEQTIRMNRGERERRNAMDNERIQASRAGLLGAVASIGNVGDYSDDAQAQVQGAAIADNLVMSMGAAAATRNANAAQRDAAIRPDTPRLEPAPVAPPARRSVVIPPDGTAPSVTLPTTRRPASATGVSMPREVPRLSPEIRDHILTGERRGNVVTGGHAPGLLDDPALVDTPTGDARLQGAGRLPRGLNPAPRAPESSRTDDDRIVDVERTNPDGTRSIRRVESLGRDATGTQQLSNVRRSTVAPTGWTDEMIIGATNEVARSPAVDTRARDGATLHRGTVRGVMWEVIVTADTEITSAYPTGGRPSTAW